MVETIINEQIQYLLETKGSLTVKRKHYTNNIIIVGQWETAGNISTPHVSHNNKNNNNIDNSP